MMAMLREREIHQVEQMDIRWLAEQLGRPGFSQAGLAKAMGKSPSAVNRILRGERQIKASELPVIRGYLGVSEEEQVGPTFTSEEAYHLALGRAVAKWNMVEMEIGWLAGSLFGNLNPLDRDKITHFFRAANGYEQRIAMIDGALHRMLAGHRNEADSWAVMKEKIQRAGRRRSDHVGALTMEAGQDYVGANLNATGTEEDIKRAHNITMDRLIEDADHFEALQKELREFSDQVSSVVQRTTKT
jgi:transcriptional regulator with XRE-family HTH domain